MIRRSRALLCVAVLASLLAGCTTTPSAGTSAARPLTGSASPAAADGCQWLPISAAGQPNIKDVGTPPTTVPRTGKATMTLATNLGPVEIAMDAGLTPCAVASFAYLAGKKFFDGTACHRLTTAGLFVLQCGDPSGTSTGGPAYQYAEENLPTHAGYPRGSVAVAKTQEPRTSGSQFFLNYADNPTLSADYTQIGTITKGIDIIDRVAGGGVTPGANGADDGVPKIRLVLQQVTVVYG
ncbi:peptidylprolyl isomerase [Dactylosporangium siamense]|uniref:Peptidyl-prolyl cis-trans isomerase n=1 Tax=Dactylosporangium siamense TaxID=685454 RepID=A0A919UAP2_9ACTN|nr:peptidylprolyl isomerase [Dactylosporangium siamense]GIG43843.1 peptidyl-prolyl cis-trans isomerase [Dactylosporangium siamense]